MMNYLKKSRLGMKALALAAATVALVASGTTAMAAPINLAALGLYTAPSAFATEAATTSLFGGAAFSADTFAGASVLNIAVSGSPPFGGSDFAISAFPLVGVGTLNGTSTHVGWDTDLIEVLMDVTANTGTFSGVSSRVLVQISGVFGSDPIGAGGGTATLGNFVPSTMNLTNVNAIPVPAILPVMAVVLAGVPLLMRRRK